MDENKEKARLRRAQRAALMNGAQGKIFTVTYRDCPQPEGQSRDETTVFAEDDPLCAALDELCATLNDWYGTMHNPWQREDRAYRKMLAENLRSKLREIIADEPDKES